MKQPPAILILLLFLFCRTNAQDTAARVFYIKEIPAGGLTLDKAWVYNAGDNPEWTKPEYNDLDWVAISPVDELHHLPIVKKAGIGWFRLKLIVDSQHLNKTFAFIISGVGASEIYLNGQQLFKFGNVSSDYKKEQTRFFTNQLLSLKLGSQTTQVLAIRYSFNKKNLYLKFTFPRPVAKIVLKEIDQAFAAHVKDSNLDAALRSIQVSFYLPLGFLLLFLFWSFRLQKEYLYSGIFCLCLFAAILMHIFALTEPTTVNRSNFLLYSTQVFYIIGALSFINATCILYKQKKSPFYYFIVFYGACSLVLYFISYDASGLFNAVFFPLINFEFLRLNWFAFRRRRKGSGILFVTSILLNFSLLLYIWFTINHQDQAGAYLQSVSFIIPGIGLSLFYAGEFARTASALRLRAIEVQKLSDEMIEAEREKQQILSSQNETLEKQVTERTAELRQSLIDLRETEQQLIQREKMASLGELTAGIAHEIQNPLNFVNNFSEVNSELLDEMRIELRDGKIDNAFHLLKDIQQNSEKITTHGKRADAIVKSMLQHSRGTGLKEETDINILADECLRLSYHGMRAKDKSFNIKTVTDFDNEIPLVNIVSQDIGRALLNLFTNAFYAVIEKKKQTGDGYEPCVSVKTRKTADGVSVSVTDNGNGVPYKILDKIFQPFFTTKPTGHGTGLGLSLSYDIITKGHRGELKVKTKEGEYSEFIINLPI